MITIRVHGPLLLGQAPPIMAQFIDEARQLVATQALADVHTILDRRIVHPTPYYETQITMEKHGLDYMVHDRGIIYGPWLEGVSHRNQVTRFKGYAAFRTATQNIRRKAYRLVDQLAIQFVSRL